MSIPLQQSAGKPTGSGTVTSVDMSVPSFLAVSGNPITTAGTLAVTAATGQTANTVLAAPDGTTGAVSLRALVAADIPNLPASKITSGVLAPARGGVAQSVSTGDLGFLSAGSTEIANAPNALLNNNWSVGTTANVLRVHAFTLQKRCRVTNAIINRGTTTASGKNSVYAIYDSGKNLVFQTPAFDAGTSGILSQAVTSGPFTLDPGTYYFAAAADATTVNSMIFSAVPDINIKALLNQNIVRIGTAANAMASLVMPSTLGTITAGAASLGLPIVFFEP